VIRIVQIVGAVAVIAYCSTRLWTETQAHRPSRDIVYPGRGPRVAYLERWQKELVYGILICMSSVLFVHALKRESDSSRPPVTKRGDI
jgi:hypothetical protein